MLRTKVRGIGESAKLESSLELTRKRVNARGHRRKTRRLRGLTWIGGGGGPEDKIRLGTDLRKFSVTRARLLRCYIASSCVSYSVLCSVCLVLYLVLNRLSDEHRSHAGLIFVDIDLC